MLNVSICAAGRASRGNERQSATYSLHGSHDWTGELIDRLESQCAPQTFCARLLQLRFFSGLTRTMRESCNGRVRAMAGCA